MGVDIKLLPPSTKDTWLFFANFLNFYGLWFLSGTKQTVKMSEENGRYDLSEEEGKEGPILFKGPFPGKRKSELLVPTWMETYGLALGTGSWMAHNYVRSRPPASIYPWEFYILRQGTSVQRFTNTCGTARPYSQILLSLTMLISIQSSSQNYLSRPRNTRIHFYPGNVYDLEA